MAEVSIDFPAHLPSMGVMSVAARSVAALPEAEREDAVSTLFKLIDSVLGSPTEAKKRRVKKSNETFHRKVGRHESAVQFLRAAGFMDDDDPEAGAAGNGALLSMPVAFIVRLTDAHHCLAEAAQQAGLQAPALPHCPVFNPYSASSTALNATHQPKVPKSYKDEAERLQQELKAKKAEFEKQVDSSPPVPLNPSAFWSANGRRLEEIVRETASIGDEEKGDGNIVGEQVSNVKAAINGTNLKFVSADKKALSQLTKKKVHEFCILRVTCPDKSVLQVNFRAAEKGQQVLEMIGPLLAPHIRGTSWYLYQTPPLTKLNPKETLAKAGFAPGANLYLGFDADVKPGPPFFEATLQAQLGTPPQDQGRGVNAIAGHFSGEAMGWGKGHALGSAPGPAPSAPMAVDSNASAPAGGAASVPMDVDTNASAAALKQSGAGSTGT